MDRVNIAAGAVTYEFTREEFEALEATRRQFTPADLGRFEKLRRRMQASLERMAATETLDEQQLGDQWWAANIERPRLARRIAEARRIAATRIAAARRPRLVAIIVPRRSNGSSGRPRVAATRSSARSGDSGDDSDDDPPEPGDIAPRVAGLFGRCPGCRERRLLLPGGMCIGCRHARPPLFEAVVT